MLLYLRCTHTKRLDVMGKIFKLLVLISVIISGVFLFYWFQVIPSEIRKQCDQVAWQTSSEYFNNREQYNWKYNQCLHSKGLK